MRLRLLVAALAAIATAATVVPSGAAVPTRPGISRNYVPGSAVATGGPIHGMILNAANKPLDATAVDLERLAQDGVNTVTFFITYYFTNPHSSTFAKGPMTPSDDEVIAAVALAHSLGLAVELSPVLWSKGQYVWRGAIQPDDPETWWAKYDAMIVHYATMAQSQHVELLTIGTELRALERFAPRWRALASQVRAVYHGLTTYMAVTQALLYITWWKSVDYIGVSPYFNLSSAVVPSYAELRTAWRKWLPKLHAISIKFGRPVLFNEVGYVSTDRTANRPWEAHPYAPASQHGQANAYGAVIDAVATQSWMRGLIFYVWSTPTAPLDKSYTPRDKLAECEMAKRWASPTAVRAADGSPVSCLTPELTDAVGLG